MTKVTREYDKYFRLYAAIHFDGLIAWPWFKAQAIAESNLDMNAVSPVGARGIMQIMPATAKEIASELQIIPNIGDPKTSINFGIYYCRKMWNIFKKEDGIERLRFALGAYNAGAGNIIKAQAETDRPTVWDTVSGSLHKITGERNAHQTINYVRRIEQTRLAVIES